MSEFQVFFQIGFQHIIDWNGYDHILFIIALCAGYSYKEWTKILILITAFTIGHSVTLALAALDILPFSKDLIETLIPLTIAITALHNIFSTGFANYRYLLAVFFGLIHGLAFSNLLRAMFSMDPNGYMLKLLAFNLGIEAAQVIVVLGFIFCSIVLIRWLSFKERLYHQVLSSAVFVLAIGLFALKIV
jgi:HupE / UreJ protein